MRFVYGHKRDIDRSKKFDVFVFGKRLRRNVEQLGVPIGNVLPNQFHLSFGKR
jgi:hypothetical protein